VPTSAQVIRSGTIFLNQHYGLRVNSRLWNGVLDRP